jgi:hypothetical protein
MSSASSPKNPILTKDMAILYYGAIFYFWKGEENPSPEAIIRRERMHKLANEGIAQLLLQEYKCSEAEMDVSRTYFYTEIEDEDQYKKSVKALPKSLQDMITKFRFGTDPKVLYKELLKYEYLVGKYPYPPKN